MDKDFRYNNLLLTIRCLDCEQELTGLDYKVSYLSDIQRQMIAKLVRKGYNDYQVLETMSMITGRQTVLQREIVDNSATKLDMGSVF